MEEDIERYMGMNEDAETSDLDDENRDDDDSENEEDEDSESDTSHSLRFYPGVPVVLPRGRFAGACNVETVKDGQS